MPRYDADVQEKAYQLHMVQQLTIRETVETLRQERPSFSQGRLSKWKADPVMDWDGRYQRYLRAVQEKTDKALVKKITPIVTVIQDIREKVYDALKNVNYSKLLDEKSIGPVLSAFVKLGDLELKLTGGKKDVTPVTQVVHMLLIVLERDPVLGPLLSKRKMEISEAVFEMIEEDGERITGRGARRSDKK